MKKKAKRPGDNSRRVVRYVARFQGADAILGNFIINQVFLGCRSSGILGESASGRSGGGRVNKPFQNPPRIRPGVIIAMNT